MWCVGGLSMLYGRGKVIVGDNAAGTAENILAHETLFRLSIFGDLIGHVIFICLSVALYRLLSSVNKHWALLMVGFVWVSAAVWFLDTLYDISSLIFFPGAEVLSLFEKTPRGARAMLLITMP